MPPILTPETQAVAGWANYPLIQAKVVEPPTIDAVRSVILGNERIIARGNGKSYGDAALAPNLLSTLSLRRILEFDEQNGIIECEAGILLSDLLKIIVPAGWFFQVTPGIKAITVGGAIASDVHGKNHPMAGCFSNHLHSFQLMDGDGQIKTCSRQENTDLFWASCGGMGWTGVVLSARFNLQKISTTMMKQKTVRCANLEQLFSAFTDHQHWPYAAGWVDCTHKAWRGAVFFGEHLEAETPESSLVFTEARKRNVPFFAPSWLLNPLSIRLHNQYYHLNNRNGERRVSLDRYFYPLDALQNWNRLYGRCGFVQYQFCLPADRAIEGIRQLLLEIRKSGETPFLSVLKRHGERPEAAVNSFPLRGYSLALDFPKTKGIFTLVQRLDELVWGFGGKIYLTKDACSAPKMGRIDPSGFGEAKFSSLLRERISV